MRLRSLHIENFGKLSGTDMIFDRPMTVILRENGWGKSTLAAFIRIMFYGFSGGAKRSGLDNERRRYRPWNAGGAYGGSLTFEIDGHPYRIERIFGSREKEDLFQVFDEVTGKPTDVFTDRIGEEIFRIDAESFSRTVFTAQMDVSTSSTSVIHARIGDKSQTGGDMERYGEVKDRLKKEQDRLTPDRKTGAISKTRERIAELDGILRGRRSTEDALKKLSGGIAECRRRKDEIDLQQKELAETASKMAESGDRMLLFQRYDDLLGAEKRAAQEAERLRKTFAGGIPANAALETMIREAGTLSGAEMTSFAEHLNEAETEEFNRLIRLFHAGIPEEQELDDLVEKSRRMEKMKHWVAEHRLTEEEEKRLAEGSAYFTAALPEEAEIRAAVGAWERLGKIRSEIESSEAARKALREELRRRSGSERRAAAETNNRIRRILGILIFAAGCAAVFLLTDAGASISRVGFGAAAALAGLMLIGLSFGGRKQQAEERESEEEFQELSDRVRTAREDAAKLEKTVRDFFYHCGMAYAPDRVSDDLYEIRSRAQDYRELLKQYKEFRNSGYEETIGDISAELTEYAQRHHMEIPEEGQWTETLVRMGKDAAEYRILSARNAGARKGREEIRERKARVEEYLRTLGIRPSEPYLNQLTDLRDRTRAYDRAESDFREARCAREVFEAEHEGIAKADRSAPVMSGGELGEKNARLEEEEERILAEKRRLESQAEALREELGRLDEAEEERIEETEKLEKLTRRYAVISKTAEYLEKAAERYSARFLDPVSRSFRKYYRLLTGEDGETFRIDSSLCVRVSECGALREEACFSAGIRDMIGLCSRMAMSDAMYPGEKPFLIFDDPFVNLDDEKQERARKFLDTVSAEYQVIILTCHG